VGQHVAGWRCGRAMLAFFAGRCPTGHGRMVCWEPAKRLSRKAYAEARPAAERMLAAGAEAAGHGDSESA